MRTLLQNWYRENHRKLPWRETKDAYRIWLSEVMLQQTRVAQGLPYYKKFVALYPTISDMAKASENEILTHWQGLGYYSRARNMHATAKFIHNEYEAVFPNSHDKILALKGVGKYTAAAISSFAFDLPYPVIDGNVQRVISRLFEITNPINSKTGAQEIEKAVLQFFDQQNPAQFNQAIMEFGSLVCTPKSPQCKTCCLQNHCLAFASNTQHTLPKKIKTVKVKLVHHSYLMFKWETHTYIQKRKEGIWKHLHQFPLIEKKLGKSELGTAIHDLISETPKSVIKSYNTIHLLSHRKIHADFYTINLDSRPAFLNSAIFEIDITDLGTAYPISVLTQKFLEQYSDD